MKKSLKGNKIQIQDHTISIKKKVGSGSFGDIYLCMSSKFPGRQLALKTAQFQDDKDNMFGASIRQQNAALKILRKHKNIVDYFGYEFYRVKTTNSIKAFLLLEFCPNNLIDKVIPTYTGSDQLSFFPPKDIYRIIRDIAQGLRFMHSKGLVHRDVKLENVLQGADGNYKLCDFGSSTEKAEVFVNESNRAALEAPQQINLYSNCHLTPKVDVWALGCILYTLLFRKFPFDFERSKLSQLNGDYKVPEEHGFSQEWLLLLSMCLAVNPEDRWGSIEVDDYLQNMRQFLQEGGPKTEVRKHAQEIHMANQISLHNRRDFQASNNNYLGQVQGLGNIRKGNQNQKSHVGKTRSLGTTISEKTRMLFGKTSTAGWVLAATENKDSEPDRMSVAKLLRKSWEKRIKISKFYENIKKRLIRPNTVITLKALIVIEKYFLNGPPDTLQPLINPNSVKEVLANLRQLWEQDMQYRQKDKKDFCRNSFYIGVISKYALFLKSKHEFLLQNGKFFEGNFSLAPFYRSHESQTPLQPKIIKWLFQVWQKCIAVHECAMNGAFVLINIKRALLSILTDEELCFLKIATHLLYAIKIPMSQKEDESVQDFLDIMNTQYAILCERTFEFFDETKLVLRHYDDSFGRLALLNKEVKDFIVNAPYVYEHLGSRFKIDKFLNQNIVIYGLKQPQSMRNQIAQMGADRYFLTDQGRQTRAFEEQDLPTEGVVNLLYLDNNSSFRQSFGTARREQSAEPRRNKEMQLNYTENRSFSRDVDSEEDKESVEFEENLQQDDQFEREEVKQPPINNLVFFTPKPQLKLPPAKQKSGSQNAFDALYSPANNNIEQQQASGWGIENNAASGGFFKGGGAWKTIGNQPPMNRTSFPEEELQIPAEHGGLNPFDEFHTAFEKPQPEMRRSTGSDKLMQFFNQVETAQEGNKFQTQEDNEGAAAVEAFLFNSSQPQPQEKLVSFSSEDEGEGNQANNLLGLDGFKDNNQTKKRDSYDDLFYSTENQLIPVEGELNNQNNLPPSNNAAQPDGNPFNVFQTAQEYQEPPVIITHQVQKVPPPDYNPQQFKQRNSLPRAALNVEKPVAENPFDVTEGQLLPGLNQEEEPEPRISGELIDAFNFDSQKYMPYEVKSPRDQFGGQAQVRAAAGGGPALLQFDDGEEQEEEVKQTVREESKPGRREPLLSKESQEFFQVNPEELIEHQMIGQGATAEVFKGEYRGTDVAIKRLRVLKLQEEAMKEFRREVQTLMRLHHPNLVIFMGACEVEDRISIVTEYCSGGTLFSLLHEQHRVSLSWGQRIKMMLDIAKGMQFLHTHNPPIIHRDLKSLNLLLTTKVRNIQDSVLVKITDFGLSRYESIGSEKMTGQTGTFVSYFQPQHWMAPEILRSQNYTIKADIFSFGVVMWEIMSRETPYKGMSQAEVAYKVLHFHERPNLNAVEKSAPQLLVSIVVDCWNENPSKRPTFQEIIKRLKGLAEQLNIL